MALRDHSDHVTELSLGPVCSRDYRRDGWYARLFRVNLGVHSQVDAVLILSEQICDKILAPFAPQVAAR